MSNSAYIYIPKACATALNDNSHGYVFRASDDSPLAKAVTSTDDEFIEVTNFLKSQDVSFTYLIFKGSNADIIMSRGKEGYDHTNNMYVSTQVLKEDEEIPVAKLLLMMHGVPDADLRTVINNHIINIQTKQAIIDTPFTEEQIAHARTLSIRKLLIEDD